MEWIEREQPLSDEIITKLEKQLGVKLPHDFVEWFKQYEDPEDGAWVDVEGEPYNIEEFYGPEHFVEEMDRFFSGREKYKAYGTVVPFAFDSTLNRFCFFYPKDGKEISGVFLRRRDDDLSEVFEGDDIKESLYISQTFQGFLEKLYIDDED